MPTGFCSRILAWSLSLMFVASPLLAAAPQDTRDERAAVQALSSGRDSFRQFCGPCHGADGKGHGPVAAILVTVPTDVTELRRRNKGVFPLESLEMALMMETRTQTAAHGSEEMPVWGRTFHAFDSSVAIAHVRVANLLAYLESIQR